MSSETNGWRSKQDALWRLCTFIKPKHTKSSSQVRGSARACSVRRARRGRKQSRRRRAGRPCVLGLFHGARNARDSKAASCCDRFFPTSVRLHRKLLSLPRGSKRGLWLPVQEEVPSLCYSSHYEVLKGLFGHTVSWSVISEFITVQQSWPEINVTMLERANRQR